MEKRGAKLQPLKSGIVSSDYTYCWKRHYRWFNNNSKLD